MAMAFIPCSNPLPRLEKTHALSENSTSKSRVRWGHIARERSTIVLLSSPRGQVSMREVVRPGDVVVVLRYSSCDVGVITSFYGNDAVWDELIPYPDGLYVKSKKSAGSDPMSKMIKVAAEYIEEKDGYRMNNSEFEAAKTSLMQDLTAAGVEADDATRQKDYSKPRPWFQPTPEQALRGAALSVPLSILSYAGFVTARGTFLQNPAPEQETFRSIILSGLWGGSALSLFIGIGLFLSYRSRK